MRSGQWDMWMERSFFHDDHGLIPVAEVKVMTYREVKGPRTRSARKPPPPRPSGFPATPTPTTRAGSERVVLVEANRHGATVELVDHAGDRASQQYRVHVAVTKTW